MTKKEQILLIASPVLVFMLTNLTLGDLLNPDDDIVLSGVTGLISGCIAALFFFISIRNRTFAKQIIFTSIYCVVILGFAFFYSRKKKQTENSVMHISMDSIQIEDKLIGKWLSPSTGKDDSNLMFEFISEDTVFVTFDDEEGIKVAYDLDTPDRILIFFEPVKLDYLIEKIEYDSLIFSDGKESIKFKRIQ